ncbi:hypothetical protein [Paracraurococcus lichenis]|uniref:DUF3253 domain-containing protein n=1 Tax=Paracraurococcus lichenis TaxID=3064888 RepID=A0ABT9EA21_9PROT|nr:hypothetical protein [Paracraurococcus sp. LOR1-02]MDO9712910.1 hypothetical protein [Paracraurococcus sp. LOR1-02]
MDDDAGIKEELKREVLGFLDAHPDAADTLEGIAQWWILHQRFLRALPALGTVLEELERTGEMERVRSLDGRPLWRAGPTRVRKR